MSLETQAPTKPQLSTAALAHSLANFPIDPLTGFYGQECLNHLLGQILAARERYPKATLALMQLENFYEIRSWLGKSEASLLLGDIGRMLTRSLPKSIVLCRCAHYEFAAILSENTLEQAKEIANQVRKIVETTGRPALPKKIDLKLGIGLASMATAGLNKEAVYARARHNMSRSYYLGSDKSQKGQGQSTQEAVAKVYSYLKTGRLKTSFQAIVSLNDDTTEHYELRLVAAASLQPTSTEQMFDIIVQNAWGESIDRWLIQRASKLLQDRRHLKLSVSITQNSIVSPTFLPWLHRFTRDKPWLAHRLIIQLSEIDVLIAQSQMKSICDALAQLELRLCINHFGCTDDPFRYLNLVRAEFVKLDSAIIKRCQRGDQQYGLSKLVEKLHANGLRVITGKVDDMARLPFLWQSRINYVQGYSFHRPSSKLDFEFTVPTTLVQH